MSTGRTIALIKALGSGGGGGGGGAEEQFAKVYENTLQTTAEMLMIPSTDIGGAYIDMVLCLSNSQSLSNSSQCEIGFFADETGTAAVSGDSGTIAGGGSWGFLASAISIGGLLEQGKTIDSMNGTEAQKGFSSPNVIVYPSTERPSISMVGIVMQNGIPAGTTITIYARKKVA